MGMFTAVRKEWKHFWKARRLLKKAGMDNILAEMQKQIDAWRASK